MQPPVELPAALDAGNTSLKEVGKFHGPHIDELGTSQEFIDEASTLVRFLSGKKPSGFFSRWQNP
jgi:hypothetical protein